MKPITSVMLAACCVFALAGCIKDNDFEKGNYGINTPENSPVGVGFPQAPKKINNITVKNVSTPQQFQVALVNLLSDQPAEQDLHVTLALAPAIVDKYNAENNPDIELLPAAAYNIPTTEVVIPKGQRTATLTLNIPDAAANLNITKTYGLGLEISSVKETGVTIAQNFKKILIGIIIKN